MQTSFKFTPSVAFGGYEFHDVSFDFYDQIVNIDPDPDATEQLLNEQILYVGIALNAAQCKYHDVNDNILAAVDTSLIGDDGGITAQDFFANHSPYATILDSVLTYYSVATSSATWFADPIVINNTPITPGIRVPENAINTLEDDAIIAMGIEVEPPFGDENEDYSEDFIPCFYPHEDGEGSCSKNMIVGYNDDYDDYTTYGLNSQLSDAAYTIVVVTGVTIDESGYISNKIEHSTKVWNSSVTIPDDQNNCEVATELVLKEAIFQARWQRKGNSRIRSKYLFVPNSQTPKPISGIWQYNFFVLDLDKNYFSSPSVITDAQSGYSLPVFNEINTLKGTIGTPYYSLSPTQMVGFIIIYESDWYGWMNTAFYDQNNVDIRLRSLKMAKPWEIYCNATFSPFYWCNASHETHGYYNNLSKFKFLGQ